MKKNLLAIAAIAMMATPVVSMAVPVSWSLSNVTWTGGGAATGSFVYDSDTNTYSSVFITTTAGVLAGDVYTTNEVVQAPFSSNSTHLTLVDNFGLADLTGQNLVGFTFVSALTNLGGTIDLVTGYFNSFEGICGSSACLSGSGNRTTLSGRVIGTQVPEPGTLSLLGLGVLGALGFSRKKRRA